jgi:hypothetical protein
MFVAPAVYMTLAALIAAGGKVTKVRWLTGLVYDTNARRVRPGMNLSYMQATLPDGTLVGVKDAPEGLGAFRNTRNKELVAWAKERGVYARSAGLLDAEVHEAF